MVSIPRVRPPPAPPPAFMSSSPARPDFPVAALGGALGAAALAAAARTQAPVELIAHHLLTLAAMPAQRLVSVRLPTGAVHPVSSYFLTLVGPGEGRSAAEAACVGPVRFWAKRFKGAADRRYDAKGRLLEPHVIKLHGHLEDEPETEENTTTIVALLPAKDQPSARPAKPFEFDEVFLSPFRSGIHDRYDRYARFGRRGGLFASVAADLLAPSGARRTEAESLSALWDGRAVTMGGEGKDLAPRLSAHLVATPGEGLALLRAPEVADSGLLGRLLAVQPASRIGARAIGENDGAPLPELQELHALLTGLYARDAAAETRALAFDGAARDLWLAFAREAEAAMADGGDFEPIRPLAGHLAEHAARLAAIMAVLDDGAVSQIDAAALARGIALARFYAAEALRLADVPAAEDTAVAALQSWLETNYSGQDIGLRDVYRRGPVAVRTRAAANRCMRQLEHAGIVEPDRSKRHGNAGLRWRVAAAPESGA